MQKPWIRAELRKLTSPDVQVKQFQSDGPFGFLVQAQVGPSGSPGEESFDFMVCTPDWFELNMIDEIALGRHYLFMKRYSYPVLESFVQKYCSSCQGESWGEVALKVGRIGHWEFEDYDPRSPGARDSK